MNQMNPYWQQKGFITLDAQPAEVHLRTLFNLDSGMSKYPHPIFVWDVITWQLFNFITVTS